MSTWIDVIGQDELPQGARFVTNACGFAIVLINLNGEYFAFEDACPHDGGELAKGEIDGDEIVCPRHGARFSIRTGAVLSPPAYQDLRIFAVRLERGRIQVLTG